MSVYGNDVRLAAEKAAAWQNGASLCNEADDDGKQLPNADS